MNGALLASKTGKEWHSGHIIVAISIFFIVSGPYLHHPVMLVRCRSLLWHVSHKQHHAKPQEGDIYTKFCMLPLKSVQDELSLITLLCIKSKLNMQIYHMIPITHNHWEDKCSEIKDVYRQQWSFVQLHTEGVWRSFSLCSRFWRRRYMSQLL